MFIFPYFTFSQVVVFALFFFCQQNFQVLYAEMLLASSRTVFCLLLNVLFKKKKKKISHIATMLIMVHGSYLFLLLHVQTTFYQLREQETDTL